MIIGCVQKASVGQIFEKSLKSHKQEHMVLQKSRAKPLSFNTGSRLHFIDSATSLGHRLNLLNKVMGEIDSVVVK